MLYAGLWTLADREGRLEDRPARIQIELFPYDRDVDIEAMLTDLCRLGFIRRYEALESTRLAQGEHEASIGLFIDIPRFLDHQSPHVREPKSSLPSYSSRSTSGQHWAGMRPASVEHRAGPAETETETETESLSGDGDGSKSSAAKSAAPPTPAREPEDPEKNVGVIAKLAHEFINQHGDDDTLKDRLKDACAQHHISYNAGVIGKAIDSARVVRRLRNAKAPPAAFEL